MAHSRISLAAVVCSIPLLCLVFRWPEQWSLVTERNLLRQGLHGHHVNVEQIDELSHDDVGFVKSSHSIGNMTDAEKNPLQAGKPPIEPKK